MLGDISAGEPGKIRQKNNNLFVICITFDLDHGTKVFDLYFLLSKKLVFLKRFLARPSTSKSVPFYHA